jgi:hypothetical protein
MQLDIKELQESYDNVIKAIADNGYYIKDGKVKENKEVYVISVSGTFYDEYMGDSDWRYREVSGDIIITDKQAIQLIDDIEDCMNYDSEDEDDLIAASNLFGSILKEKDSSFERLYSVECAEFNEVNKSNQSVWFTDRSKSDWDFKFDIHKKPSCDVEEFSIDDRFGCI